MPLIPSSIINFRTFREEGSEWRHFAKVVVLVVGIPIVLISLLCEFLCWQAGELIPDQEAAERQKADPRLIWFAHNDGDAVRFKLIRVNQERPDVLILGQSRMGGFRSAMFAPYSFYNMSRVAWPVDSLCDVMEHLPADYSPKVIIFTLDFNMLSPLYTSVHARSAPRFTMPKWEAHLLSLREALLNLTDSPWVLFSNPSYPAIGLNVRTHRQGFRQDGSFIWMTPIEKVAGADPDLASRIKLYEDPFVEAGTSISDREGMQLVRLAKLAKLHNTQLIGVQMPLYRPGVKILESDPRFPLLATFRAHLANGYFDRMGIIVFDYLNFPPYSSDYHNFGDPVHPLEPITAAVVLKMAEDPRVKAILPKLNTAPLQQMLERAQKSGKKAYLY